MSWHKKVYACVEHEDGTSFIAMYKLRNNLSFSTAEMKKWIKEQSEKKVKRVTILK
jgi:hypothetical protein